jgi:hypothetical protein
MDIAKRNIHATIITMNRIIRSNRITGYTSGDVKTKSGAIELCGLLSTSCNCNTQLYSSPSLFDQMPVTTTIESNYDRKLEIVSSDLKKEYSNLLKKIPREYA